MASASLVLHEACFQAKFSPLNSFGKFRFSHIRILYLDHPSSFSIRQIKQSPIIRSDRNRSLSICSCPSDSNEYKRINSVHIVGIGGSGMSALALLAHKQGLNVSGSDFVSSEKINRLQSIGIDAYINHNVERFNKIAKDLDAVLVSSAIPSSNVELKEARRMGIKIFNRREWLKEITRTKRVIAVSGTHGKSTTSAMLALALQSIGLDICALVGADVKQFPGGLNLLTGDGPFMVIEADEYDSCFLGLSPEIALVLNVEWEHVDIFPDEETVKRLFRQFVSKIIPGGTLLVCGDGSGSRSVLDNLGPSIHAVTYGLNEGNDWRAVMVTPNQKGGTDFVAVNRGIPIARVSLSFPGLHMVLNSLAVIATVALLKERLGSLPSSTPSVPRESAILPWPQFPGGDWAAMAAQSCSFYEGAYRRYEVIGQAGSGKWRVVEDYAHHPTEVRATLMGARQALASANHRASLWVVFQPHTFSRLSRFLLDFSESFSAADRVFVTDVYGAREVNTEGVTGSTLAEAITGAPAVFIPSLDDVLKRVVWEVSLHLSSDWPAAQGEIVILILGAGDITQLGPRLVTALSDLEASVTSQRE